MNMQLKIREEQAECETHGAYVAKFRSLGNSEYGGNCPGCIAAREHEEAERERKTRYHDALDRSALPPKFRNVSMAATEIPDAVEAWFAAMRNKASAGPLLLEGPVGVGKTHLAAVLLKRYLADGRSALYASSIDYARRVRETWSNKREESERVILERHAGANLLVLDEVGANRGIDENLIQDLICARYDAGNMPHTIIASNVAGKALAGVIGERAADRIKEGATVVAMVGQSRRMIA